MSIKITKEEKFVDGVSKVSVYCFYRVWKGGVKGNYLLALSESEARELLKALQEKLQ